MSKNTKSSKRTGKHIADGRAKKYAKRTWGSSMTAAGPCKVTKADGTVEIIQPRKEKTTKKVPRNKS